MGNHDFIWVFIADDGVHPFGMFNTLELADQVIQKYGLSGVLTRYPVDIAVYDWAVQMGYFKPKSDSHSSIKFIERFSCASLEHYHYRSGVK